MEYDDEDYEPLESYEIPKDFSNFDRADQVRYMLRWFHGMFEDPQNETPYDKEDGPYNYLYLWGGPYDANDELSDHFSGLTSWDVIEEVVKRVQSDGITEWAPGPDHSKLINENERQISISLEEIQQRLVDGAELNLEHSLDTESREVLQGKISRLRNLLNAPVYQHGAMGHNRPPEPLDIDGDMRIKILQTLDSIESQLKIDKPDVHKVVAGASYLKQVLSWGAGKANIGIGAFVAGFSAEHGLKFASSDLKSVWAEILNVFSFVLQWLNIIIPV